MAQRLRDGHGKPVPQRLREPFLGRSAILEYVKKLQGIETRLVNWSRKPGGECLNTAEIHRLMHALQFSISNSVPYEMVDISCSEKEWMSIAESNAAGRFILPEDS